MNPVERRDLVRRFRREVADELADRLRADEAAGRNRIGIVTIGDAPYPLVDVAAAVAAEPVAMLPVDDRAAAALAGWGAGGRKLARSPLLRSARELAERLAYFGDTAVLPAVPGAGAEAHITAPRALEVQA